MRMHSSSAGGGEHCGVVVGRQWAVTLVLCQLEVVALVEEVGPLNVVVGVLDRVRPLLQ
jgi:hypothetical protein